MRSKSTLIRIKKIGVFTQDGALKERYRPLKFSLVSVKVKSQLDKAGKYFIKITEDLTKQERILVKEWQDKANNKK